MAVRGVFNIKLAWRSLLQLILILASAATFILGISKRDVAQFVSQAKKDTVA
jgi:hypothetical protein